MSTIEKKLYLLYNPKSGRETIKNSLSEIVEKFTAAGYEVTVRPTMRGGEAEEIIAALPDTYETVVSCGGDGTLNETVNGLLQRETPLTLGYIPCGSTNDFGNTIYGTSDLLKIVDRIIERNIHPVDCGRLADKHFVYTAGFGLFTDISYETPHETKAALGHAAYILEAVMNLGNIKAQQVKAVVNDTEVIEGTFLIGLVTNADYVGGMQNIVGKDVSLQDGELELTLIGLPTKPIDYGKLLEALTDGSQNECVIRRKVQKVTFTFTEEVPFTVDGEYGGSYTTVEAACVPAAFPLVY